MRHRECVAALLFAVILASCGTAGEDVPADLDIELSEWAVVMAGAPTAGEQVLAIHNEGVLQHELIIVATDDPEETLPTTNGIVDLGSLSGRMVGEVAELLPGEDVVVSLPLEAGTYIAFCNIPGHYPAGMHAPVVVAP